MAARLLSLLAFPTLTTSFRHRLSNLQVIAVIPLSRQSTGSTYYGSGVWGSCDTASQELDEELVTTPSVSALSAAVLVQD